MKTLLALLILHFALLLNAQQIKTPCNLIKVITNVESEEQLHNSVLKQMKIAGYKIESTEYGIIKTAVTSWNITGLYYLQISIVNNEVYIRSYIGVSQNYSAYSSGLATTTSSSTFDQGKINKSNQANKAYFKAMNDLALFISDKNKWNIEYFFE